MVLLVLVLWLLLLDFILRRVFRVLRFYSCYSWFLRLELDVRNSLSTHCTASGFFHPGRSWVRSILLSPLSSIGMSAYSMHIKHRLIRTLGEVRFHYRRLLRLLIRSDYLRLRSKYRTESTMIIVALILSLIMNRSRSNSPIFTLVPLFLFLLPRCFLAYLFSRWLSVDID